MKEEKMTRDGEGGGVRYNVREASGSFEFPGGQSELLGIAGGANEVDKGTHQTRDAIRIQIVGGNRELLSLAQYR